MGYALEFNCLLVVDETKMNLSDIKVGETFHISKEGERIYPLNIAIEVCDSHYQYIGKVAVKELTLSRGKTELLVEVLKVFTPEEAAVYTNNFIAPKN